MLVLVDRPGYYSLEKDRWWLPFWRPQRRSSSESKKITAAEAVETSVTNSLSQHYSNLDDLLSLTCSLTHVTFNSTREIFTFFSNIEFLYLLLWCEHVHWSYLTCKHTWVNTSTCKQTLRLSFGKIVGWKRRKQIRLCIQPAKRKRLSSLFSLANVLTSHRTSIVSPSSHMVSADWAHNKFHISNPVSLVFPITYRIK